MHFNHLSQYMPDELKPAKQASSQRWRILGWLMLGGLVGATLAAAFVAYGQPELLLESLNLRYCG